MIATNDPVAGVGDWMEVGGTRSPRSLMEFAVRDAIRQTQDRFTIEERASACAALWAPIQAADIDYEEHPAIGVAYASWYHLQRVNTAAHAILTCFANRRGSGPIRLYDLGSGTGAVAWAVGLALCWMEARKLPLPAVTVVSVESCGAIHEQADVLWREFRKRFPAASAIRRELQPVPWQQAQPSGSAAEEVWVTASYLFGHGDRQQVWSLASAFGEVVDRLGGTQAALVTSDSKGDILQAVLGATGLRWTPLAGDRFPIKSRVKIERIQSLRDLWREEAVARNAAGAEKISGPVMWVPKEEHPPFCAFGTRAAPGEAARKTIRLPTAQTGPAGCDTCGRIGRYTHGGRAYCKTCYLAWPDAPLAALGVVRHGACHACRTRTELLRGAVFAYCRICFPKHTGLTSLSA